MDNIILKVNKLLLESDKGRAIKEFQDYVNSNDDFLKLEERIQDILTELSHDLDFFEPDAIYRREDPSFYDETRFKEEVAQALEKLNSLQGK